MNLRKRSPLDRIQEGSFDGITQAVKGDKLIKRRDAGLEEGVRAGNEVGVGRSEEGSDRFDRDRVRVEDWPAQRREEGSVGAACRNCRLLPKQILVAG